MKVRTKALVAVALAAGLTVATGGAAAQAASSSRPATALYDAGTKIARFQTEKPSSSRAVGTISGLAGDTLLVGIDRRVQNGQLYGVGNQGGLYIVSDRDATATKVGQLSIALDGTNFGVDFNPAANALRIISNTGQNLRQPFGTGDGPTVPTVADTGLNYATVAATGVTGAAYTNNDLNADTGTTLFDLDTNLDQVAIQSPANSGGLAATGKLGVDAGLDAGFDIFTDLNSGKASSLQGFAVVTANSSTRLYTVNLLTGALASKGSFNRAVSDIALDLDR